MASSFGKLDKFDPEPGEEWICYFFANEITLSDKQRVLTSAMGAKSYKLLRNLITLKAPSNKSFKELVKAMMKQFCPPSSETV